MFDPRNFIEKKIREIKGTVGGEKVVVAVSGGVDSTVCAMLAWQALPKEQLLVFTIDDGLRREGEPQWVVDVFDRMGIPVKIIHVQEECFQTLRGKITGDEKRTAFSNWFGKICGEVARDFEAPYAVFGSNALDSKETQRGTQKQHNAWQDLGVDTQKQFGFQVVEPIRELYKEEIRQVAWARSLGIPPEISERMPFPGPGLAIRVKGEVTKEKIDLIRPITAIIEEELNHLKPFQCLACLMQDQATGIRDERGVIGHIVSVRCVDSEDSGQTATPTQISDIQPKIVDRILRAVPSVVRVVFDPTPKPPARIEYE